LLTVLHELQDDMQVVLGPNRVHVLDDIGVIQFLEEKNLCFDGGEVFGLDVGELEALDCDKVTSICSKERERRMRSTDY